MTRRRTRSNALDRIGTAVLFVAVLLLGGAVGNSGGGRAVAWAIAVAVVAMLVHALLGRRTRRSRRTRSRSRRY